MKDNKKAITWIKKAKTLLEKIIKMAESDKYCIDIIQQNLAVIGLMKSANISLLESHLWCCFIDAIKSSNKDKQNKMIDEILRVVKTAQNK